MLIDIARFEFRYLLRNPLLWITAAATFALFLVTTSMGFGLAAEGGLLENAAWATLQKYLMVSVVFMFVTTSFVANAVLRDDETGFGPIIRSTRIGKAGYLIGRFGGAFAVTALCLLLVPLGVWLGSRMPWADPAALGPVRLADHLYGYLVVALPNLLIHSAVFFALATVTRSMMASYLGVIGFISGFFVLQGAFADRPQLDALVAIAEPFGGRALTDATRYWTVAERNVALPDLAGVLLYNRLLWIGIALLCLALAHAAWRVAGQGMSKRERRGQKLAERASAEAPRAAETGVLPRPQHGPAALRALLWMRTRFEIKQVVLSPAFVVLTAWGMYITLLVLTTQRDPDGRPTYPTTLSMIPEIAEGMGMTPLIVAIFYAGELVWRERDRRMHELVDAAPMPSWVYVVSKTLAMGLVLMTMLLASVAASVALQLSLGFTELELGKYLLWHVLPTTWDMLLLAALAIFVQAISPHKAVGWGIMVLFLAWQQLNTAVDHNLLRYGGTPGVPLSDMNGAGSFWVGAWTFRVYWGAFAVLLLVAAHLLWRRGTEVRLRPRLAFARRRLRGAPGWLAGAALLAFTETGAYGFYNTDVLNEYRTQGAGEAHMAAYEKKYGRYADLPQPRIVELTLDVALYPEERRAVTKGRYRLRNLTARAIPDIHVRVLGDDLELAGATIPGARLIRDDAEHGYRIYRLDRPMQPGEERVMAWETRLQIRGFRNQPTFTRLVENGTFLNESHLMPAIGLARAFTLQDPEARRKYALPRAPGVPKLEDVAATANTTYGRGWAKSDITVSTSADQTPLAPGNRVSDVVRGGRRTARFVSAVPIHPRFSIQSARYAEKHRRHAGVDLAVYYHPAHAWNVDRMLDAMAAALDYYQANFGPYPFDHARIVEFPGYLDFAQAFPGTIPYSEDVGFASDFSAPESMDYVTYLTAHELAHQYWAHQVVGAEMEGRELLSETLAQYSAQMVVKKLRGEDYMRRYLRYELDRYLEGREYAAGAEPTLTRVDGQDHVTYRKGALAMYLLQRRMGEDAVNRALRTLLGRYRFAGAPYPRSLDLVAALRAEARTPEEQALITDLFERLTLYHLQTTQPTAVRRADGRWDVTVPVEAKKLYVDSAGAETEVPLAERIEIGLFTAEPGRDAFDPSHVVLLERHPIRSGRQVLRFVTDKRPTHAGIDPYNYYIDRNSTDNVLAVK
ncbi:M1 family aminopeptidase [Longimicrobium sp.]|uniref:M1 family aminopeptidase n=1 Tax=Longimicrobium sp. TaxID=2029185 RepID=UPI003B3AC510